MAFAPDYQNLVKAAYNKSCARAPLYEHIISDSVMESVLNVRFSALIDGDFKDKKEYFRQYCRFFKETGYDTVSFEQCITKVLPGAGALYKHTAPVIRDRSDFACYPWQEIPALFTQAFTDDFLALTAVMPDGMKAVGGPGNGLFEIVQDLCGYEGLCYIFSDDPELFSDLFVSAANMMLEIWQQFLMQHADLYCIMRFGDDLGYKTQTLFPEKVLLEMVLPKYKKIVQQAHSAGKPFLLHSCGKIFSLMNYLIHDVKINAKHSNEDAIAPFQDWVDQYGSQIGNFGGIDTDILCRGDAYSIREYCTEIYRASIGHGGIAYGSGNSIPDYIPPANYLTMVQTIRSLRGE